MYYYLLLLLQLRKFTIEGDKSLDEVTEQLRANWGLEPWIDITITRVDKKPFWIEEKGEYTVITQYNPDRDPRPECTVRVDLADRTFVIERYRAVDDPVAIWADLCKQKGRTRWMNTTVNI
jgi:hypothetical protein